MPIVKKWAGLSGPKGIEQYKHGFSLICSVEIAGNDQERDRCAACREMVG